MTSQSVLKSVQIFSLREFLWEIIPLIDYKKRIFKTDANLSLKRRLALKGRKSCANVKNAEGSSPLSLSIVLKLTSQPIFQSYLWNGTQFHQSAIVAILHYPANLVLTLSYLSKTPQLK